MTIRKILLIVIFLACTCFVEMISAESYDYFSFKKELKKCFETNNNNCKAIILRTEQMQLKEYYKGNLKCQTSILGLQTELIRNIYFDRHRDNVPGKTISSLIKNC